MGKGEQTRAQIVERAMDMARTVGLEGLSLGALADSVNLSKSGLFAHFKSKEGLQLEVLQSASDYFNTTVVVPALAKPRGEARVRALFNNYLTWIKNGAPSGCIFMSLAHEFDDRPGPVRDRLIEAHHLWRDTIAKVARHAAEAGYFHSGLDDEQFAFEFVGIATAYEYALKLLQNPRAMQMAQHAFDDLLIRSQAQPSAGPNL